MTRKSESVSITAFDSIGRHSAVETLLTEYHAWLAGEARKAAATSEGIEAPSDESAREAAAEDVRALAETGASRRGFLVRFDGEAAGVSLLYGVSEELAEVKRLYVRPEHRGKGLGRALCSAAIETARADGYERVGLTTPPWSEAAHALYEELGFAYTDAYPETTLPERFHEEALFMQLALDR